MLYSLNQIAYFSCSRYKIEGELGDNNHRIYFLNHLMRMREKHWNILTSLGMIWGKNTGENTIDTKKKGIVHIESSDNIGDQQYHDIDSKIDDDNLDDEDNFSFNDINHCFQLADDDAYNFGTDDENLSKTADGEGENGLEVEEVVQEFHQRRTILADIPNWRS